ncbi:SGNH hydrolase [Penicillium canescens]|nr:SGNH hydrolase [Penicillium canescens]
MDWISSLLAKRDGPTIGVCGRNAGSGLLPDSIGKIFHPTNLGHESIASYVTWTIGNAIAKREGVTTPACQIVDEITCHSSKGSKGYASAYSLYAHTKEFCKDAVPDMNSKETGTLFSKRYNKNTLDDVVFTVTKDAGAADLDSKTYNTVKSGGTYANGPFTYNIAPVRTNRPFPVPKTPLAKYTGDKGQKTLRGNSTRYFGLGLIGWWFEYFDKPDSNGYEWLAKFNSPIATEARCYSNNKVQKWSGGPSHNGCH